MSVIELKSDNFDATIQNNNFVVVDFWAEWCEPCKNFTSVYEKVSNLFSELVFAKVNSDDESDLASHFNIRSIPTLLLFRQQIIIGRFNQSLTEEELVMLIEKAGILDMNQIQRDAKKNKPES